MPFGYSAADADSLTKRSETDYASSADEGRASPVKPISHPPPTPNPQPTSLPPPAHPQTHPQPTPSLKAFARRNQLAAVSTGQVQTGPMPQLGARSLSLGSLGHGGLNPVMNETLSVIEEHITDMNTPRSSLLDTRLDAAGQRMSYINGHETDEEDVARFTEREVRLWTPSQVAEHLEQMGADRAHCKVFRDQEITGDVLLEMDRETILLKEFELGTLGRRLALFQKIQRFQTEVKTKSPQGSKRSTVGSHSDGRSSGTVLPKIPSLNDYARHKPQSASTNEAGDKSHASRPSAASTHSVPPHRRHSSIEYPNPSTPQKQTTEPSHAKNRSFDRTWTMASQSTAVPDSHPVSTDFSPNAESSFLIPQSPEFGPAVPNAVDLDRGYFSNTDDKRHRVVLRKRDSTHARAPSDGHGSLRLSGVFRHMRNGSTDSLTEERENKSFFKRSSRHSSRKLSAAEGLDAAAKSSPKADKQRSTGLRAISDAITSSERSKLDAGLPKDDGRKDFKESKETILSPARTDSSNQSITSTTKSVSFDEKKAAALPSAKYVSYPATPGGATQIGLRKKGKHETSAYARGLERKTPAEQMAGADYSGWMRKKSKTLGKWHSRLFVLRGRRLSYYYTEDDEEEKGLIDISFHRVLPANKDLLTGFHATLAKAGSPVSPAGATLQTAAQIDMMTPVSATSAPTTTIAAPPGARSRRGTASGAAAGPTDVGGSIFIFKLVPPRPGQVTAVNFTQPKVHFFAVGSLQEGRNWMAALMKATIERDELKLVSSTYKEKTISLGRARELRVRPKEFDEDDEDERRDGDGAAGGGAVPERGGAERAGEKEMAVVREKPERPERPDRDDEVGDGWSLVNGTPVEAPKTAS